MDDTEAFMTFIILLMISLLGIFALLIYDKINENDAEVCLKDIAKELCKERETSFSRIWGVGFTENNFVCLDDEERVEKDMLFTNEEINRCLG